MKKINEAWVNGRWGDLAGCFHEAMVIVAPGFQETQRGRDACVDSYRAFVTAATIHEYTESDAVIDLRDNGTWRAVWRTLMVSA